ncbi:radical SAM protein [Psychromonas sp. KJ10-10]|uniref:radical SAM protein n=1 Tax=Psychromonas sp. KJ10-10 TaxID=3391823 RepID=UPI0039B67722
MKVQLNKIPAIYYWDNFLASENIVQLFDGNSSKMRSMNKRELFHKFVCIINIETSTFCNKKCTYCPISTFDRKNQILMDDLVFTNIVTDLQSINYSSTISLNIFNEPLADNTIYEKIQRIRSACPDAFIKFNSNGDYIKLSVLDRLASLGVNAIFVTLHPEPKEGYSDKSRLKHFKKFFSKLELNWEVDELIPAQKITSDNSYKGMRLLVEAHNWEVKGNDRGGFCS